MIVPLRQSGESLIKSPGLRDSKKTSDVFLTAEPSSSTPSSKVDFGDVLSEAVDGIRSSFKESADATEDALLGRGTPHGAMIAMSKAGLVFRFAVQTRNKVIDAYRDLMSMQV